MFKTAFENWDSHVYPDLLQHFGIDLADPVIEAGPWWRIYHLIIALFDIPTSRLRIEVTRV